jgi:hypothetical protein
MANIEIGTCIGDPLEAEIFGMDPIDLFGPSFGHHAMNPGDPTDVIGIGLPKFIRKAAQGVGKVVSAPVKVATKVVAAPVKLAAKGVKAIGNAPGVKQVVSVVKPIVNNPVVKLVAPQVPAVVGKGPMFDLGAKLNPGVAALAQAGKGRPEAAISAAIKAVAGKVIPAGAAFVAPVTAAASTVKAQADKLVKAGLDPRLAGTAKNVVNRTVSLAAAGDVDAKRAVSALQASANKLALSNTSAAAKLASAYGVGLKRGKVARGSGSIAYRVTQPSGSRAPNWNVERSGRVRRV